MAPDSPRLRMEGNCFFHHLQLFDDALSLFYQFDNAAIELVSAQNFKPNLV